VAIAAPLASQPLPVESKVELQAPLTPQPEAASIASDRPASGDNLFHFPAANRSEERVAARTDVAPASANVAAAPPNTPAAAAASLPAAYPVTNSPSLYQDAASAAPSYPQTAAPVFPPVQPRAGGMPFPGVAAPPLPAAPPPGAGAGMYSPPGIGQAPFIAPAPAIAQAPAMPQAPAWQPPAIAQAPMGPPPLPAVYQSPETIARGARYERTGSGNY
jgi:hypothetical protein